ncbi:MAG: hypothetical protein II702_06770 [Clostridia bacterium]|nr:hypothetical protein [Clostridia bacterium]
MSQCVRCGYKCDGDIPVCPNCKTALVSSDVHTALDALSGYYDYDTASLIENDSVVVFRGETQKEAIRRVTKGRSRAAFICGLVFTLVFAAVLYAAVLNYSAAGKTPKAVGYRSDVPEGTYVTYEIKALVPLAESHYSVDLADEDGKTIYCLTKGSDGTYAVSALPEDLLYGKYTEQNYGGDAFASEKTAQIKGTVTKLGSEESKILKELFDSSKMNFSPENFISVSPATSKAVTGTILLLISLFVLGTGLMVLSFGFRRARRQAAKVKKAFKEGNF